MAVEDGMPDLGNLPIRVKAIRNKRTGVVFTKEGMGIGEVEEGQEHPWNALVRRAYNHQDGLEMLYTIPGETPVADDGDEPAAPTLEDGRAMTAETLDTVHWQTLRKLCKKYGGNPDGKGKKEVIEMILRGAYHEVGLEAPVIPE